jgi:hypothetical protein
LRLHGLIERVPSSHRYRVTDFGFRTALLLTRNCVRLLRRAIAVVMTEEPPMPSPIRAAFKRVDVAIERAWQQASLTAPKLDAFARLTPRQGL